MPESTIPPFTPPTHQHEVRRLNRRLAPLGYKWCGGCCRALPVADFTPRPGAKWGVVARCRACIRVRARTHPAKRVAANRHRNYGVDQGAYEALLAAQGGGCAICGRAPAPYPTARTAAVPILTVDHDHTTGAVRGLLCPNCNAGLGQFRDNPALVERARAYLRTDAGEHPPTRIGVREPVFALTRPAPACDTGGEGGAAMPDRHLTKQEAAAELGISTRTVERRLRAGQLRAVTVYGAHGPERRVVMPATGPTTTDAPPVTPVEAPTAVATPPGDSLTVAPPTADTRLLLATLAEFAREREALATRLGEERAQRRQAETERDALRAQLDKQAREEDTARPGALQRAWWRFWRRGGE